MGSATQFYGANRVLHAPPGHEGHVSSLHTFNNGACSVSCWTLALAEFQEVVQSGYVWLSVFSGQSQPPVFVGSRSAVRGLVADYGPVWPSLEQPPANIVGAMRTLMLARDALPEGVDYVRVHRDTIDTLLGAKP